MQSPVNTKEMNFFKTDFYDKIGINFANGKQHRVHDGIDIAPPSSSVGKDTEIPIYSILRGEVTVLNYKPVNYDFFDIKNYVIDYENKKVELGLYDGITLDNFLKKYSGKEDDFLRKCTGKQNIDEFKKKNEDNTYTYINIDNVFNIKKFMEDYESNRGGQPGGWGNHVVVRGKYSINGEEKDIDILYAHLKEVSQPISKGSIVEEGQQIGLMGSTGNCSPVAYLFGRELSHEIAGTHLHLGIYTIDFNKIGGKSREERALDSYDPTLLLEIENKKEELEDMYDSYKDKPKNGATVPVPKQPPVPEQPTGKKENIFDRIFNTIKETVFPPTVLVRKGSIDEAILRAQYDGLINFVYAGINQFIGRDREQTNLMYQEYIKKHFGISPVNPDIDLSQYRTNEKDSSIPPLNWLEVKTRFASSAPTLIVKPDSKVRNIDRAILKGQYGEGVIKFEEATWNQFIGSDREETNKYYQQYLEEIYNLKPKNTVDLYSYHDGGIVGGEATNNLAQLANRLFNTKPNESVVKSLIGELQVPPHNIIDNFIPNMKLFHTLAQAPNDTVQSVYLDINIDQLNADKEGAEKFFKIIGNEMKRKGVRF